MNVCYAVQFVQMETDKIQGIIYIKKMVQI